MRLKNLLAALAAISLSGCATLPTLPTNDGAAGVVKALRPEYAGTIDKIADILVGKRVNPVEGFAREERWYHKDEEINPNDLRLEVLYRNAYQVSGAMMSARPQTPEGEVSDAELRAEIEAILKASGVAQ